MAVGPSLDRRGDRGAKRWTVKMHCPNCGLAVRVDARETANEVCLRCLARSSGGLSVHLVPGAGTDPVRPTGRVRALRRLVGGLANAA